MQFSEGTERVLFYSLERSKDKTDSTIDDFSIAFLNDKFNHTYNLRCEYGHPSRKPKETDYEWNARLKRSASDNQCINIASPIMKVKDDHVEFWGIITKQGPMSELVDDNAIFAIYPRRNDNFGIVGFDYADK